MKLPRRRFLHLAAGAAALPACIVPYLQRAAAQSAPTGMLEVPARMLPVPDTVSPQMQALIARPVNPRHSLSPQTAAARASRSTWRAPGAGSATRSARTGAWPSPARTEPERCA